MKANLKLNQINKESINKNRLLEIIANFKEAKVTVVGDLILDEFLLGCPSRISREAPVIILKYLRSSYALGGGSNAANNIASLGGQVDLIGILGKDPNGEVFARICKESGINLITVNQEDYFTTTKSRIISTSTSNPDSGTILQQQVLRIDRESKDGFNNTTYKKLEESISTSLRTSDITLISDYSNGVVTKETAQFTIKQNTNKSIIDSNGDLNKFHGAYSMTPNQPDLENFYSSSINSDQELIDKSLECIKELELNELLVTRGAKGMLAINNSEATAIPAFNLSEVFDVTGAGDTVSAAYSLSLAVGANPIEAALLGNLAASIVVRKYGTATCSADELTTLIKSL